MVIEGIIKQALGLILRGFIGLGNVYVVLVGKSLYGLLSASGEGVLSITKY